MTEPDDLVAAVRELRDRGEIADLVSRYCLHFDANEPEAVAALFTEDAVIDYGPEVEDIVGREAIVPRIASGLATTFAATSHHVSNLLVDFDGVDGARSVCLLYAWHRYVDGSPDAELWGRYRHTFRRTTDGWLIASLRLEAAGAVDFHRATMHGVGRRATP